MPSRITLFFEGYIPPTFASHSEERRKAHLALGIALLTFIAAIVYSPLFYFVFNARILAAVTAVAALQALATFPILKATSSMRAVGHNLASGFFIVLTMSVLTTGGVDSVSSFAWVLASPMIAVILAGKSAGKFWTVAIITIWSGIVGAQYAGVSLPASYDSSLRYLLALTAFPGAVIIIYLFASLLETGKEKALALAEDARTSAQESLEQTRIIARALETEKQQVETLAQQSESERVFLASRIERMLSGVERFASGDLTIRFSEDDEGDLGKLSHALNAAIENLQTMVISTFEALLAAAEKGERIADQARELDSGVHEQSGAVLQIATAMRQISATIEKTSESASQAAREASETSDEAHNGGAIILATIEGIAALADIAQRSAAMINNLGKSGEQIGEITQTIEEIADQTNLLALNAAIEAARAGDAGRGFAVVADEVRKLAERTQQATKEIAAMLKKIQEDTQTAILAMNEGDQYARRGKEAAENAVKTFQHIIDRTRVVADAISYAANASVQQGAAGAEIARNMDFIGTFAKQTASGLGTIASGATTLTTDMKSVHNAVSRFRIGAIGFMRHPTPPNPSVPKSASAFGGND